MPSVADATPVISPGPQAKPQIHYFKREALYDIVWTAPVMEVGRRLGISDVALANSVAAPTSRFLLADTGHASNPVSRCGDRRYR